MRDVLREEKKFLLNQAEALKLRNYLSNVVHTDLHNGPDGYQVRSLYFDSLSNRDFQEKEDGLELRRKLRLRIYSPDADFALFEMKQKQGPYQRKRSLRLSRKEAQALIEVLTEDPFAVPPRYERLVGDLAGMYSRRINIQHRLVYEVFEEERTVRVLRMWTHYE